jgi:glycosyltransferase involved in cell wall biosynthesis
LTVGLPGLIARWLRRRPFVFEVRDLFSEGLEQLGLVKRRWTLRLMRGFEAVCYRTADVVVALSPSMAEWIERDYRPRRVVVIPNASDNALFAAGHAMPPPAGMKAGGKAFLFTGTIGTANDCGQLVDAAEKLRERGVADVDIYLVGDGKERARIEARAGALGLENIHFIPLMPKDELVAWLAHARAALLILKDIPVFETVSPNKLFDALAAGLPVIQTTRGWIRDLLAECECGLTVDFDDPDSLVDHILTLARDDDLSRRMGENAAKVGRERFDRDLLSKRYTELLREVSGK